jgi:hypothetical protein
MVNTKIGSRFTGSLPVEKGADRTIPGGPLYPAHEILELLASGGSQVITTWTQKCVADVQKWSLDTDDLFQLLELAVRNGRFRGAEWCAQKPNGPWAACDAYSVIRMEWIATAHKEMNMEYYIKFAIGKTGKILLLVSCHPSENRR